MKPTGISYLNGKPWSSWSREERFFCAVLFEHGRRDPAGFARWVFEAAGLGRLDRGAWDLGYEVCLYRDFLWQQREGSTAAQEGFPRKRTFDLCLFGEQTLVIVEAKVCQRFERAQLEDLRADRQRIKRLKGIHNVAVKIVALASGRYFTNLDRRSPNLLEGLDGRLTWREAATRFNEPLFDQAEAMYAGRRGQFVEGNSV